MQLLEQLELMEVVYEDNNNKAVLTFLDRDAGEIREVNFNKKIYENDKYVENKEKAEKVEKWCKDIFDLTFDNLTKAIGEKHDIYAYDNFNSLFEVDIVEKFSKDMVGQIIDTEIKEIIIDDQAIKIRFDYEDKTYESRMGYAKYLEDIKTWFVDPQKKKKQYEKFIEKFGVPCEEKDSLIGQRIMVEVKIAFNKFVYNEIKPLPKKK